MPPNTREQLTEAQQEWRDGVGRLITYRYLGTHAQPLGRDRAEGWLPIRRDMRGPVGLLAAPLGIALLATAGVNVDPLSVVSPTRIDMEVFEPAVGVAEVHLEGRLVSERRTQFFTEARLTDVSDRSRVIATGGTHWSVSRPCPEYTYVDARPGVPDSPDLPPLYEPYGGRMRSDGKLEIPEVTPELGRNGLHQGPFQVVPEAAGMMAAAEAVGTDQFWIEHQGTSIVARGLGAPLVAHPEVVRVTGGSVTVRVEMRAEGDGDKLCSTTVCRFRLS